MVNRKQSLRGYRMIRCPQNTQQTEEGRPQAESRFQKSSCYVSSLKSLFSIGSPVPPFPVDSPHMPENTPQMVPLRGVASDALTIHS